jgi:adenine-specific DNA methylase
MTKHMPDNSLQIVMFTHQDAAVWADLGAILWAAGLRVTAAWNIVTETESALKEGRCARRFQTSRLPCTPPPTPIPQWFDTG